MLEYDEFRLRLVGMEGGITELKESLDIAGTIEEIKKLEDEAAQDGFWDDMENSQKVLQKTKQLKDKVEKYETLVTDWEDAIVLCDLANEENDESMLDEITKTVNDVKASIEKMTLETH